MSPNRGRRLCSALESSDSSLANWRKSFPPRASLSDAIRARLSVLFLFRIRCRAGGESNVTHFDFFGVVKFSITIGLIIILDFFLGDLSWTSELFEGIG